MYLDYNQEFCGSNVVQSHTYPSLAAQSMSDLHVVQYSFSFIAFIRWACLMMLLKGFVKDVKMLLDGDRKVLI